MSPAYHDLSDVQLVRLIQKDDHDAFSELSSRYLRLIRGRASGFQGNAVPEKEDLCQEGFLGLYLAARSYESSAGASFRTYAGICIYRRMASAVRTHGSTRNRFLNESVPLDSLGEEAFRAGETPEALVETRESVLSFLRRMEVSLSPLEKKVLVWHLSGYERDEIPEKMGISLKTYDNAMYRLRSKLKEPGRQSR